MVKTIDLLEKGDILPPVAGTCQECGFLHNPKLPHNLDTLYYQYSFKKKNKRWPTWEDAIEHCSDVVKKHTIAIFEERKIDWRNHDKTTKKTK